MKTPDNLVFLQVCPHDLYFAWQLRVQITNFREFGISDKMQVLIWYPKTGLNSLWKQMQKDYPEVSFYFYEDRGVNLGLYISTLRPHTLSQHFKKYKKELDGKVFFYHDSDILFSRLPDFESLCSDDICYVSDTVSYIGAKYLRDKAVSKRARTPLPGPNFVIERLALLHGLEASDIIDRDKDSGGAQYLLKNIDYKYWEDVEKSCLIIRTFLMIDINQTYFRTEDEGYQSWCADMWAVLYNLWNRGIETKVHDELDFSWATDIIEVYEQKPIFHLAGAGSQPLRYKGDDGVEQVHYLFYKGAYTDREPFKDNFDHISPRYCSYKYVEALKKVDLGKD